MTQEELQNSSDDERIIALQKWFEEQCCRGQLLKLSGSLANTEIIPVSGDASFRRYFRVETERQSFILVDAPPQKEDSRPFVKVAQKFLAEAIHVPEVYSADFALGFMCLSDFGDELLWDKLDAAQSDSALVPSADVLYQLAFDELLKIQACKVNAEFSLPPFDKAMLHREMGLFKDWFCEDLLGLNFDDQAEDIFLASFDFLSASALAQPQVCVHRDYHSRNFLYQHKQALGVIDFQDAVLGAFTYDLVSLLKDCYISWPREQVNMWALDYAKLALEENIIPTLNEKEFLCSFDLMGVQRHLKAIGIFSRLYLRDKKSGYLADIPRTLAYILAVVQEHKALSEFSQWLETNVVPCVEQTIEKLLGKENVN